MRKGNIRVLSMLLAIAMLISLAPALGGIASATGSETEQEEDITQSAGDNSEALEEDEGITEGFPSPLEADEDVSIFPAGVLSPSHTLDFSDDTWLTLGSDAWVENGVVVLTGKDDSYATVNNVDFSGFDDSITIYFNARLFSGPTFSTNTERTLLFIGSPKEGGNAVETALYVYATSNSIRAAISDGTTRKEVSVTATADRLNNNMWRSFAVTYSPDDGGTLAMYTQSTGTSAGRAAISNVGVDLEDILTAPGVKYSLGQSLQTTTLAVQPFRGGMDNITIWDSALTQGDISELHVRQRMLRDLQHLRLDTEENYMYNEQAIQNPVIEDVMLYPESRGLNRSNRYPISWSSNDTSILTIESDNLGNDIFARFDESAIDNAIDKTVTLRATIKAPDPNNTGKFLSASKDLVLSVPSQATRRQMDCDAIEIQSSDDIRENVPLSAEGKYGSHISWKSSNPAVVSDTAIADIDDPFPGGGVVTRPGIDDDPVNVKLTATVTMDGVPGELTKEFDLTITPLSEGRGVPSYEDSMYLFTFYAEGYDWNEDGETTEEMYFAISPDADEWRTLNLKTREDGSHYTEPIFTSTMGDMGLRDAHFVRSPDGDKFYAMSTDLHWSGSVLSAQGFKEGYLSHGETWDGAAMNRTISVWDASSLTSWGEQRLVRPASQNAGNAFAPESIWDEEKQAHLVYWQQNDNAELDEDGNYISNQNKIGCMWKCYTRDFVTFTEPEYWYGYDEVKDALVYNDTKYVVDTHIAYDESDGYYYRFASSNRCFVERSKSLDGPWVDLTAIYHGNSNREGATTFQLRDGTWAMMLDNFSTYVRYDMVDTGGLADLLVGPVASNADGETKFAEQVYTNPAIALNEGLTDQRPGSSNGTVSSLRMKHGMVMQISEAEYWQLIAKYGTMDDPALGWVVDSISVTPRNTSVGFGSKTQFAAEILGENIDPADPEHQTVKWTVEGAEHEDTVIDEDTGILTVSPNETAESVRVRATHTHEYFELISGSTVVYITSAPKLPFTDVKEGSWYYNAVEYTYTNGLIAGVSATKFAPQTKTTREMFVTVLARLAKSMGEDITGYTNKFTDVPKGMWYSDAIAWGAAKGLVSGYDAKTFGLGDNVTREQMAAFLVRFAKYMEIELGTSKTVTYTDASSISKWAKSDVTAATAAGLFVGDNGKFYPQRNSTRAEMAQVFMQFCQLYID